MVESRAAIPFQTDGKRFSHVPRDRQSEKASGIIRNGQQYFDIMEQEGALTPYYVVLLNREGASPDSPTRPTRDIFESQGRIVHTIPLDGDDGAVFDLMGSTTAPYAAAAGETHFLGFVTRNGPVPTFGELTPEEAMNLHRIIGHTLDYLQEDHPQNKSYIGFSFSPLESRRVAEVQNPQTGETETILFPRSPVQNIATIHAHIVSLQEEQLKTLPRSDKIFDERMLREPRLETLTEIFRTVIFDPVMEQFPDVAVGYAEHVAQDNFFPKGSFLIVHKEELKNPRFAQLIQALHQQAERAYFRIADTTIIAEDMYKGEIHMRPRNETKENLDYVFTEYPFHNLSDRARRFLRLFSRMKDPKDMAPVNISFTERTKIAESFVLLGISYNIVYYYPKSHPEKAVVVIEPRFLSGASPTETLGIFKDQTKVTSAEYAPIHDRNMQSARALRLYLSKKLV